jgi:hypothetical protein
MLALAAVLAESAGCVERRMTIRSNPDGAMVYIDDYPIGTTPVSVGYTYYGTRKIRLIKDGYETMTVYQPMPTPWYEWFGVDFFSENVWPGKIRDERSFNYQLSPIVQVPNDQLVARAEQLRAANRSAMAAEAPMVAAPPLGVPPATSTLPPPAATLPPAVLQPAVLPPPTSTSVIPNVAVPPTFPAPIPGTIPNYTPPGGAAIGGSAPAIAPPIYAPSGAVPASPGAYPNYPLPGGTPTPAPGGYPGYSTPSGQPVLPPDWRPMGQAPNTAVQR